MSLPVVVIFERHWDTIPRFLVRDLLPDLAKQGYDTLCLEAPQNITSAEIVDRKNCGLEFDSDLQKQAEQLLKQVGITRKLSDISFSSLAELMRLYVSSKKYLEVAEKIKQLPADRILKDIFNGAARLSVSVKGIDINDQDFCKILERDVLRRMPIIKLNEEYRLSNIFNNILKLRAKQEGIVFICGAIHAEGLLAKFKEKNMQEEVLYYFPHSSRRYDDSLDEFNDVFKNETLLGHTHLLTEQEVGPFSKRIVKEVVSKVKYKKEIPDGNSHSRFLSNCFKTNFMAFLRPGYYVDALVDASNSQNIENIRKRISEVGVWSHDISLNGRKYLVIPSVNTLEIAERIRKIQI